MAQNKDIKQIFDLFLNEKNLLNSKFSQKVHIHTIKAEQVKQMFDNFHPDPRLKNQQLPTFDSSKSISNKISTMQEALLNNPVQSSQSHKIFSDPSQSPGSFKNNSVTPIKRIELEVDIKV